jgi:PAS domain S-box-containing protein
VNVLADVSAAAGQAWQDAEARLRDFLRLAPESFWELDADLRYVSHSGRGAALPAEEIVGRTPWEVFGGDSGQPPWSGHVAALRDRLPFRDFEHRILAPDGTARWRSASGDPVFDRGGRFRGYRGITTDITDRKQAEERLRGIATEVTDRVRAEERLSLALDAARAVVWELDLATGRITRSASAWSVFGVSPDTVEDFLARIHPDDRARHDALFDAAVAAAGSFELEVRFIRPDGALRWLGISARARVEPDGCRRVFGVTTDITARKEAERLAEGTAATLRATLEAMDQGLVMVDAEETVQVYNEKALDLLDLPASLMQGHGSYKAVKEHQRAHGEFAHSDPAQRRWLDTADFLSRPAHYERERPNGTILEVRSTPIPGGGAVRIFTDITARRRAELHLHESEQRFRDYADLAADWLWELDEALRFTRLSGRRSEAFGRPTASLIGESAVALLSRSAVGPAPLPIVRSLEAHEAFSGVETRMRGPDGGDRWLSSSARPIFHADGRFAGFRGVSTDLTARKAAEMEAQKTSALLQATLGNMDEGLIMVDAAGILQVCNRRAVEILDLPAHYTTSKPTFAAFVAHQVGLGEFAGYSEADTPWLRPHGNLAGVPPLYERTRPNGTVLEIRTTHVAGGGVVRTYTDITARRKAEMELRESEARFRNLADNAPVMVWVTEPDGSCTYLSRSWYAFTGQTPATALGFGWLDAVHPDDRAGIERTFREAVRKGERYQTEYRLRHHGGAYRWAIDAAAPRFGHDGTYLGHVGSVIDITQRKHTEEALSRSREELRAALDANRVLLEHSLDVICTIDEAGAFVRVSPHAVNVWGYTPDELVGRRYIELVHPDDRARTNAVAASVMAGTPTSAFENRYVRRDGSVVPILWSAVWSDEHRTMFCVARDISERLRTEEQLRQSQKMEAVGQLTGGVAHDFNNLLTVVIGNTETLVEVLADPGQRALAQMALDAAEKGAELTRHLLAFGRRQSLKPEPLSLGRVVAGMAPLLRRTLGAPIEFETVSGGTAALAFADRTFLESAILNLAVNAKDAMPHGGTLTIATGERAAFPGEGALQAGQAVVFLTVSDTGTGMAPEVVERAFEPFYTTKEVGKGSGLGLSMVWGFARQSGGHAAIESRPGEGTAVTIVLPASRGPADRPAADAAPAPPEPERRERVLLVEDEPQVLRFASAQLAGLGYEVVAVATAQDALDRLRQDSGFDLLFTDVVLPRGLSGVELARQARMLHPGLGVLLTSGYAEEAFEHYGRPDEGTLLLRKPYRRRELAAALRDALRPAGNRASAPRA